MEVGKGRGKKKPTKDKSSYQKREEVKGNNMLRKDSKGSESLDSSSDEDDAELEKIMKGIVERYVQIGGADLGKTQDFLLNFFQSSSNVCLICISSIKRIDQVWNCSECYGCFHMSCIQKWSRDSLFQLKQAMEELPVFKRVKKLCWGCPKCRKDYEECDVPHRYACFCLKVDDPANHPWFAPHSCGDVCGKPLQPNCGHTCLLLCHPGPCPPCPKTVKSSCYCGRKGPEMRRCNEKAWSCQEICKKKLICNKHVCPSKCHAGVCPPCPEQSKQSCDCGLKSVQRPCAAPKWKCDKVCGKKYSCGHHVCEVVCHSGECGLCPLSLNRTCPCGKTEAVVPCTQEIPTCNDTCGKMMECGIHKCQLKCHKDKCACLEIVRKTCRCGLHQKELPCGKEYTCETKCRRTKSCQKHPCNRKCCDGECPACEKMCGKTLSCGVHKCQSLCHLGACYPCMQTRPIKCHCSATVKLVPCGSKRKTAPPRCKIPCRIPPACHHTSSEVHACHFGECPPCKQICKKRYEKCGHNCLSKCHEVVWRKVEYNTYKWDTNQPEFIKVSTPCPPCEAPVSITCWGNHETWTIPCNQPPNYSCLKPCKKPLNCTNHTCPMECHQDKCMPCELRCQRDRPEGCSHSCDLPCHGDPCKSPCVEDVKVKCHCGISTLYIKCHDFIQSQKGNKLEVLSCGTNCQLTYPCGHKCRSQCHPGSCPDPESCRKKVKVSCNCSRLKKEFTCDVIRRGEGIVPCNADCDAEKFKKQKAKEFERKRLEEEAERKNKEELEKFEQKLYGKKKGRDRRRDVEVEDEPSFVKKYLPHLIAATTAILISLTFYFTL